MVHADFMQVEALTDDASYDVAIMRKNTWQQQGIACSV